MLRSSTEGPRSLFTRIMQLPETGQVDVKIIASICWDALLALNDAVGQTHEQARVIHELQSKVDELSRQNNELAFVALYETVHSAPLSGRA